LLVAGPSGSGKSSLILAGLLPRLKAGLVAGSERWHYLPIVTPGSDPLAALLQATCPPGLDLSRWISEQRPRLQRFPTYFKELVQSVLRAVEPTQVLHPAILVIDQFEELFTLCTDQQVRAEFVEALLSLLQVAAPQHRIVLTVREDFVGPVTQLSGLGDP